MSTPREARAMSGGRDEHRSTPDRVGQAPGRQFEGQDDKALDREDEPDLGEGQPT